MTRKTPEFVSDYPFSGFRVWASPIQKQLFWYFFSCYFTGTSVAAKVNLVKISCQTTLSLNDESDVRENHHFAKEIIISKKDAVHSHINSLILLSNFCILLVLCCMFYINSLLEVIFHYFYTQFKRKKGKKLI